MKKNCEHFIFLKPQKVANFIKKAHIRCSFIKHTSPQYNLCLHCGQTRCDTSAEYTCSELHSNSNKHYLVFKLITLKVYCFHCDVYIEQMLSEHGASKGDKKKLDKVAELNEKIVNLAVKFLGNSRVEKKVKQNQIKTEKSLDTNGTEGVKKKELKRNNDLRVFGLANIGNTCYFNSILQCLYALPEVHQLYSQIEFKDEANQIFRKFLKNTEKVYCPKNLLAFVSKTHKLFRGMNQQDAFQLYILLLNSLIESVEKKGDGKPKQSLSRVFGFVLASRLQCLACGEIGWNKDFSLGISIPLNKKISKKNEDIPENCEISAEQIGEEGLYYPPFEQTGTFLDNFFAEESLQKNSYRCENCEESNAIHKFYIKNPPSILTINFKRFNNAGLKINGNVAIPQQLTIDSLSLTRGHFQYQLYAGVVHSGNSSGGHYIAITKRNEEWFYFSDSHYKPASFGTLKKSQPYVLFYRQVHIQYEKEETVEKHQQQSEIKVLENVNQKSSNSSLNSSGSKIE